MTDVASQRLEVGDDEIDLPGLDQLLDLAYAFRRLAHGDQVPGNCAFVAHPIIHVGKVEAEDFRYGKIATEIAADRGRRMQREVCGPERADG